MTVYELIQALTKYKPDDDVYMIENGKIILHEETDVLLSEYGLIKATNELLLFLR